MIYLELIATGLGLGAMYGVAGMGFNLIFSTTRVFDIAIGATYLIVAYIYYSLLETVGLPWPLAILGALLAGAVCEVVYYQIAYKWVERRSPGSFFGYFVASFGILTLAQNLLQMVYGSPTLFASAAIEKSVTIGSFAVPLGVYVAVGVAAVCYVGLTLILQKTGAGVRFRALAENSSLLRTVGVPSQGYRFLAFALGAVLVGAAAIVLMSVEGINPGAGFTEANLAIAAMLVGGIGSYMGALVGGIALGVISNLALAWISGGWVDAIAFGVLLVVLLARPQGLLQTSASI